MQIVGDDQVEILGSTSNTADALRILGLTNQEYEAYCENEQIGGGDSSLLQKVLTGNSNEPEVQAARQKEVIRAFRDQYQQRIDLAADRREERIHQFDGAGLGPDAPNLFSEYNSITGYDIASIYEESLLRPGSLEPEDAKKLEDYKKWLYDYQTPLTGEDEPLNLA